MALNPVYQDHLAGALAVNAVFLIALAGCGSSSSLPDGDSLVTRAQQVWKGDWHAVWQVEWAGAPVRGPLVAEVWHAADGRLRIETLEASSPALSGLTLVDDGATGWLYDLRQNRVQSGPDEQVRIPLASDALDATDWLLLRLDNAAVSVSGRDTLESGLATRLDIILAGDDRAVLWVHGETGMLSRVELRSAVWGEATFSARSVNTPDRLNPALFVAP